MFQRENYAFFRNRLLVAMFAFQLAMLACILSFIFSRLAPALKMQPQLIQGMINRQFSTSLLAASLLSVFHVVQMTTLREKTSGLLETLLTTPLHIHDLVIGKMLHTSMIGLLSGIAISAINLGVICFSVGSADGLASVPPVYFFYSIALVPCFVTGVLSLSTLMVYRAKEPTIVIMTVGLGVGLLVALSNIPVPNWVNMLIHGCLILLSFIFHIVCWSLAKQTSKESIISG